MRFLVARDGQSTAVYLVDGDDAYRLTGQGGFEGTDRMPVIDLDPAAMQQLAQAARSSAPVALSGLAPALPLQQFRKVLCLGLNYVDHVKEGGYDIPTYPAIFMRVPKSLMAAGEPMIKPDCSDRWTTKSN